MQNNKSKIVMLDDGETNSTMGKNILNTFFEVYPAPTAASFFEILEKVTPDLILLDMELPDVNGDKTVQKIKADNRFSDIPVILLGSQEDESDEPKGFKLGAADCIAKPFSGPSLLKRVVNQLLIIQKDKVTAAGGKAAAKVVEKLNRVVWQPQTSGSTGIEQFPLEESEMRSILQDLSD